MDLTKKKIMNIRLLESDYKELQQIAKELGGMSLSSMIRTLIFVQLDQVRASGDSKSFLNINSDKYE